MRFLAVALLASLTLTPIAGAQQPAQPPQPPAQQQPTQPDLFQETLKAQRATDKSQGYYDAAAVAANVFLVPGRAITCGAGALVGVTMLALTFGTAYKFFGEIMAEGCGGKWVVKGDDIRPDRPVGSMDWDRPIGQQ